MKMIYPIVDKIEALRPTMQAKTDEELRDNTRIFKERLAYVIGGIHFIAAQDAPCHRRHLPSSETQFYHREPYL